MAGWQDGRKGRQKGKILQCCNSSDVPVVDDAHDAGVDGWLGGRERKARLFAADEEHFVADERPARRLTLRGQRLDDEQLDRGEPLVLARHHDVTDHSGQLHWIIPYSFMSTVSTMPMMAASTGQSFKPDAMRAELPLTTSTVSPTPASTVSM